MDEASRSKIVCWVGSEIIPHEADVRAWLRRSPAGGEAEDIIQETYCRLSALESVDHIGNGRAYLFTTVKHVLLERLRRSQIVSIEAIAGIESLDIAADEPSPERVVAGRRELARVKRLIDGLPERCRQIFELRKMNGMAQREVAAALGVPEHIVENEVAKGLKLILRAIAEDTEVAERTFNNVARDERARDSRGY